MALKVSLRQCPWPHIGTIESREGCCMLFTRGALILRSLLAKETLEIFPNIFIYCQGHQLKII